VVPASPTVGAPDGGQPQPDAGPPDAGPPDAGPPDAGPPDAGPPDAGPPDAGPSEPDEGTLARPIWPELQTSLPTYALTVAPEHLEELEEHIEGHDHEVPGQFTLEGRTWHVQIRYRGRSTRFEPKKPWHVSFDKQDRFQGSTRLELLAAYKDGGYLTEKLWYDLAASVGLKVPRVRYVHVTLNGQYQGVYTEVEAIDKAFLRAHGLDSDSDIYRCGMQDCELRPPPRESYMEPWDKRTNESQPWDGLWGFIDGINRTPSHQLRGFVEREVALDDYLTWMALDTFIANDYHLDSRSYLIYEPKREKWFYVPWDLNNALSLYSRKHDVVQGVMRRASRPPLGFTAYDPYVYDLADLRRSLGVTDMKPVWNTLTTRIVDDEVLRARYVARMRQLMDTWITEENLGQRIDAMHRLLAPFILAGPDGQAQDPFVSTAHAANSDDFLKNFVRERRRWLLTHLGEIEAHGQGPLVIDRVGRDASGAWWVQIYNRGSEPQSLQGLYLSGFTRVPTQSNLPAVTVPPQGFITLQAGAPEAVSRLEASMNPQRPELSLYAADGRTPLDLLWLAPLAPGEAYGRQPRGAETFAPETGP
jgi:spore coat protein H